jgi:hypothetical protein
VNDLWKYIMTKISNNRKRNNILKAGSKNLNTENWKVYHPNGQHMFTCGEKKAAWYLERGLAERNAEGKITLTFEPKGVGFEDNEVFGRSVREPICVVTGTEDGLQRHHIVPYCYRTYFPEAYKSKNHHDVVLIHHAKHSEYEKEATKYKDIIAEMFGVKTIGVFNYEYNQMLRKVGKNNVILLNTLYSIFKSHGKVSDEIKLEKLKFIAEKTEIPLEVVKNYTYVQLYKFYVLLRDAHREELENFKTNNRLDYDHGYHVVQKLDTEEKISDFVKLWRKHFIDTMQPQYMPNGWSIDFRIKTKI